LYQNFFAGTINLKISKTIYFAEVYLETKNKYENLLKLDDLRKQMEEWKAKNEGEKKKKSTTPKDSKASSIASIAKFDVVEYLNSLTNEEIDIDIFVPKITKNDYMEYIGSKEVNQFNQHFFKRFNELSGDSICNVLIEVCVDLKANWTEKVAQLCKYLAFIEVMKKIEKVKQTKNPTNYVVKFMTNTSLDCLKQSVSSERFCENDDINNIVREQQRIIKELVISGVFILFTYLPLEVFYTKNDLRMNKLQLDIDTLKEKNE